MLKRKLEVPCPAKINLFLSVGARDSRGYHPIRTIFQAIDLFDTLEVTFGPSSSTEIEVVGADLPSDNTVSKALRLGREVFDLEVQHVKLVKRIPMQSGLGGGSSDAAGILRALNHIRPVPLVELVSVASAIGADVPFFLTGGRAKGEGYGDQITALPDAPKEWLVVAKPEVGCPTAEMYSKLDAGSREFRVWPTDDVLSNDFESVAPLECIDLIEDLRRLGTERAGLSGSGSAVFGIFTCEAEARTASGRFEGQRYWICRSLGRTESTAVWEP